MPRLAEVLPRRIDLRFLLLAVLLTAIGIVMVVSTTAGSPRADLARQETLFPLVGLLPAGVLLARAARAPARQAASLRPRRPHRRGRLPRRRLPHPPAVRARPLRAHAPCPAVPSVLRLPARPPAAAGYSARPP